jgi:hypothetical protein
MLEQFKRMLREVLKDDEIFDLIAQGFRKTHTSLVKAGFTEDQATQIVASQGMGIRGN